MRQKPQRHATKLNKPKHTHDKRYERIVSYSSMRLRMKETYSVKSYLSSQEVDELQEVDEHYYS